MSIEVKNWLAQYYDVTKETIGDVLKDEKATSYLLVWGIFEQIIFNGYMRINEIQTVSGKFENYYVNLDVDDIAQKFHSRYQDNNNYRHLVHGQDNANFRSIIGKQFEDVTEKEKLAMLFYIVYRYRNNIFHGNKNVKAWTRYTEQIQDCITFITAIIDLNKKEQVITSNNSREESQSCHK